MDNQNKPSPSNLEIGDVKKFVTNRKTFVAEVFRKTDNEVILDPLFDHEVEEFSILNSGTVWECRYPSGDKIENDEEDLGELKEILPTEDE